MLFSTNCFFRYPSPFEDKFRNLYEISEIKIKGGISRKDFFKSSWVHELLEEYSIAPSASRVKPVEKPGDSQSKRSDTSKDNSDSFGVNSHSLRFQSFDRKFPAFFSHASVPIFNGKENRNRFHLRKT